MVCDDDRGTNPNALGLTPEELKMRQVDWIDIVKDPLPQGGLVCKEDPSKFVSEKTGRGPLRVGFEQNCSPAVCIYKVVRVRLDFGPFQKKAESLLLSVGMRDLLLPLHRQIFCWMDEWWPMTLEEVHAYEKVRVLLLLLWNALLTVGYFQRGFKKRPINWVLRQVGSQRGRQAQDPS